MTEEKAGASRFQGDQVGRECGDRGERDFLSHTQAAGPMPVETAAGAYCARYYALTEAMSWRWMKTYSGGRQISWRGARSASTALRICPEPGEPRAGTLSLLNISPPVRTRGLDHLAILRSRANKPA